MKHGLQKYSWLIVPLVFLLYSAPGALDFVFHFPDEKYYTDAVLQMMDKGDYLTPYKADGTPRFLKPIVTYWVLIGSYSVFGVSPFSSRILFWIAGALLAAITYRMTRTLVNNKPVAMGAAFITAASPLVLMGASRSIPDILLVLFLTVSAWGFLRIMIQDRPAGTDYWLAYLGAALAFQTKGLPAVAFAGISLLYMMLNPWKRKSLKQLIHPGAIVLAILVAASWFVLMYLNHGTAYLSSFFADQVGYRVSSRAAQVIGNTALGTINLAAFLVPWIVIAFSKPKTLKSYFRESDADIKAILGFTAIWVVTVIAMSGAVFKFYDRYLLPVIPVVAMALALIITRTETRFEKFFIRLFLWLNIVITAMNALYWLFILPGALLLAGTATGIISLIIIYKAGKRFSSPIPVISASILLLWFNLHILLYTLLMPNPGEQLVQAIAAENQTENTPILVYGNIRTASNIRIHSGNELNVISMDTVYTIPKEGDHILVFSHKEEQRLNLEGYRIEKGSEEWKRLPPEKFPAFMREGVMKIKESGTTYFIAIPERQ